MKIFNPLTALFVAGLAGLHASATYTVIDFEELPEPNPNYSTNTGFNSQGVDFLGGVFTGWVYSDDTDTTTPGFLNQYSAFPGSGVNGSDNYGVSFGTSTIELPVATEVLGGYFTNTTYAALSMLNGDAFAKQFGGDDGTEPDWFQLTITGYDGDGATGSITFDLADYTAPTGVDELVDTWTWINLLPLGEVTSLGFSLASSDVGSFGMNTPAYFALDDLYLAQVPEPASLALAGLGLLAVSSRRRRA